MIDVIDVSYAYSGRSALRHINLHIEKGEAVALMGANGCGKSTLLKLLNGIITPDAGVYRLNGEEITKKRLKDANFAKPFHQRLGFVFQNADTQLFCGDVYDEIAFGPRQMGLDESEVERRVNDCMEMLGLKGFGHLQSYHLSGGEKKKIAIASVLALNPDVIMLDEPLSGLDPRSQRWLVQFLVGLNQAGKTLITSTHNLELVQELSKRAVLFNEQHEIAADKPTEELLSDIELLKQVNLVDEYYHRHEGSHHTHFHIHHFEL